MNVSRRNWFRFNSLSLKQQVPKIASQFLASCRKLISCKLKLYLEFLSLSVTSAQVFILIVLAKPSSVFNSKYWALILSLALESWLKLESAVKALTTYGKYGPPISIRAMWYVGFSYSAGDGLDAGRCSN